MSREDDNIAVVHRWFKEVWNEGRPEAIDELFAADGIAYGVGEAGRDLKGPAAFKPFFFHFRSAFPDPVFTVHDTVAQGDKVASRWSVKLVHRGEHLGIAPTGKEIEVTGMSFVRVRDGQITDAWNNWDLLTIMTTITSPTPGVCFVPEPAGS